MGFNLQLSVLLLLLLIMRSSGEKRVRPRRQTRTSFGLEDLKDECCALNRWSRCCSTATRLSNDDSEENRYFQRCRSEAQNEILDNQGIVDIRSQDDGDFQQGYFAEATGNRCPVSRDEKVLARVEYCTQLSLIHLLMYTDYLRELEMACVCARPNTGRPNLSSHAAVLKEVKDWYRDMVERHRSPKKCCNESAFLPPPPPAPVSDPYSRKPVLLTCSSDDSRVECNDKTLYDQKWDYHLATVARAMRMVEMLESLGRRTTCVRGCVGESEVKCANLITGH